MAGEQWDSFALRMVAEEIAGDADPGAAGGGEHVLFDLNSAGEAKDRNGCL
jgi:hypothetical protein